MTEGEGRQEGQRDGGGNATTRHGPAHLLTALLQRRLPLWATLLLLVAVAVVFGALLVSRQSVDLGPAVDGATRADVSLTICNEIVDSARSTLAPRSSSSKKHSGTSGRGRPTSP